MKKQKQISRKNALNATCGKVAIVPLTPLLQSHCDNLPTPTVGEVEARGLVQSYLDDIDIRQVKKLKGRAEYETIGGYLNEIPGEVIARVAEVAVQLASGVRWGKIYNGQAFNFWVWVQKRYPVLQLLDSEIERVRGQARANKALDTLDTIAEEAEQDGARVKACELTLRAHHKAFGAKTEAKEGNTRPIVVVNIASIFGEAATKTPQIDSGNVVDA